MLDDGSSLEHLSAAARHVLKIDADTAYTKLVPDRDGSNEAKDALELIKPTSVTSTPPVNQEEASAAVAGLWLWHDFLDISHTISQSIETPTGSFWHAIMHRREGDFSNAKYWYRRVGTHPALKTIAARINVLTESLPADKMLFRLTANGFDPMALVDLVEAVHASANHPHQKLAVSLQKLEWQTLMETCVRAAVSK
jgi:hypothetical protein